MYYETYLKREGKNFREKNNNINKRRIAYKLDKRSYLLYQCYT